MSLGRRFPNISRNAAFLASVAVLAALPLMARSMLPLLMGVVVLAAWKGGRVAALVVTAMILAFAFVADTQMFSRPRSASLPANLLNFAALALLIATLTEALTGARRQSDADTTARRQSEERYRVLFEANPHPMWVYDVETLKFLAVNEAAVRRYGYTAEEFLSKTIADIRPDEDVPTLMNRVANQKEETYLNSTGWRHVLKDGSVIDVEISSHPLEMEGRPARLVLAVDITNRKRAEEALLRSEARSRRLVDSNLIGVAFIDGRGLVVDANDAFLRIAGVSRDELQDGELRWQGLVDSDSLASDGSAPLGPGGLWYSNRFEADFVRKDGSRVPAQFGIVRLEDGSEDALCFALERTGLRRAERERDRLLEAEQAARALAEASESRYRMLARAIPQIVWTSGTDGIDYFNPRWTQYSGLDKLGSLGNGWLSRLHPEDRERFQVAWSRALELKEGFTLDVRLRRADGAYRWHLLQALSSGEKPGRRVRWLGTFTDIDDQKRAEGSVTFLAQASAALSSSLDYEKTLARVALLAVPDIADLCQIDMVDDSGGLCRVAAARACPASDGGVHPSGRSPGEPVAGHPAFRVLASGRLINASRPRPGSDDGEGSDSGVWSAFREAEVISYISAPLESRGRVLGVITFAMAGSGRRYAPIDLPLAEQLARRAAVAVENARLYQEAGQMRREAEVANRSKDRFLAVLSHELRTPLNPVLIAASAHLDDPKTPAEMRPMLDMIRQNIQLEARLIGDLLDVSRISAGKMRYTCETVDAHDVIRLALTICEADIAAAGLALTVDLSADQHAIEADATRLQQVVWNLAKNAAKFTPSGGSLVVRSRNEPSPDGNGSLPWIVIEVEDTGIGIEADVLPKVFDAFEQGNDGTARRSGGLGLGLAISRAVVEAHGGRLSATSGGPGQCSTFRLELPTVPTPTHAVEPPPAPDRGESRPLRLLLVEDNRDTLRMLTYALEQKGHTVVPADSVEVATAALDSGSRFDLLISDIELPDGDGRDLMSRLARDRVDAGIAMSGYGTEDDVEQSLSAGFAEHLTKPVAFGDLEQAIQRVASSPSPLGH